MENTKQTPQEKSTLSDILEQIKIVFTEIHYSSTRINVFVTYGFYWKQTSGFGKVDSGKLCNGSDCDYREKCREKT